MSFLNRCVVAPQWVVVRTHALNIRVNCSVSCSVRESWSPRCNIVCLLQASPSTGAGCCWCLSCGHVRDLEPVPVALSRACYNVCPLSFIYVDKSARYTSNCVTAHKMRTVMGICISGAPFFRCARSSPKTYCSSSFVYHAEFARVAVGQTARSSKNFCPPWGPACSVKDVVGHVKSFP